LVISNFSANPLPRAQRPGPSDSYHDKDPSQTTDWQFIRNFTANTRNSDSLVYALARKEAFLQATHIPIKFRDNFEIVDLWVMMALRFTLKGNLLFSPMAAKQKSLVVLDLQGIFRDQFSWQIALDYPQSMVYGLCFTPGGAQNPIKPTNNCANQDSEKNYATKKSYPSNYIPCVGHSIKKLPFEDNTFDIVNAKSLWYLVKKNDWVDVLSELFRIIKPGGYIELLMADFVLLNGNATDQYWWSRLVQGVINHGLEPAPMSTIATQLYHVGFTDVNRALISLPRGWGGQMGHLTDLLAMYYSQFMFQTFSDLTSDEMVSFKTACRTSIQKGYSPANSISFTYAQKPL
jgi:ubiquinone/menaquinone biosynthesis C-methylase UbiE